MTCLRISLICCVAFFIAPAFAQEASLIAQTPHITTTGTAHAEFAPDLAIISFAVVTERPTASAAANDNATAATAVVGEIKAQGIDAKDIRTVSVTLTPVYDEARDLNGRLIKRTLRAYSARNALEVRMRALDKAGPLARQLIEKGANNFGGIAFDIEHPETKLKALQTAATKDALAQAQSYADALGLKLVRVLEILPPGESQAYPAAPRAKFAMVAAAPPPEPTQAAIPIEPGVETLSASVTVTWELGQ